MDCHAGRRAPSMDGTAPPTKYRRYLAPRTRIYFLILEYEFTGTSLYPQKWVLHTVQRKSRERCTLQESEAKQFPREIKKSTKGLFYILVHMPNDQCALYMHTYLLPDSI